VNSKTAKASHVIKANDQDASEPEKITIDGIKVMANIKFKKKLEGNLLSGIKEAVINIDKNENIALTELKESTKPM
jgi:hypothetical protein